jgi:hypothetical protein
MHPISSSFKSLGRAAVVALSLAGAAILSVPVQASSGNQPQFSFSLQLGNGGAYDNYRHRSVHPVCLSLGQIVSELQSYGFSNVTIGHALPRYSVLAFGAWHHASYSMTVNRCSGLVSNVQRVRTTHGDRYPRDNGYSYDDGRSYVGRYPRDYGYSYDYGYSPDYYDGYDNGGSFQFGF